MKYLSLLAALIFLPLIASAQAKPEPYKLLEPLPGLSSSVGVTFGQLLSVFFTAALSLSAAAAVVMITLGGVQYMFSDAVGAKSVGRERIKNAILGLILVFASWLIINTVNPNLLLFQLKFNNVGGSYGCLNWICQTQNVDRTIRDSTQANKDVQTATGNPGSFRPSMQLPNQRLGADGQPSSEAGKAYVKDCRAIGGTPMRADEQAGLGTYTFSCQL